MKTRIAAVIVSVFTAALLVALCGCTGPYDPNASMKEPTIEAEALHEPGVLHVGVDASTYPFAGQANGKTLGLCVDLASALAQEMGVRVEFVDVGAEGVEALSGDEVDIVMNVVGEEGAGACWTSDAYAPSCIALFSMDEGASAPKKSKKLTIAAQTSSLSAWLVTRQYGNEALQAEDDLNAMFTALQDGTANYAAADAVVGKYMLNKTGIPGYLVALMEQPDGYCIGVAEDNVALQTGVTQALSTIQTNGIMDIIMVKWTGGIVDISSAALTANAKSEDAKSKAETLAEQAIADNADGETPDVGTNAVTTG